MIKRVFDFILAFFLFFFFLIVMLLGYILASIDTASNGFFLQKRIGRHGKVFRIYKLRTMHSRTHKISILGSFFRKSKLDEIPQLINILNGTMSFVGPRPDIPGYADKLTGDDQKILNIKPGITGLASLKYRNEEYLLLQQANPKDYNDYVIWPDKVRINKWYAENQSFLIDIKILWYTVFPYKLDVEKFMLNNTKY
ncbi:sugar transferase [Flavobacterium sp.]|uniref:sugar transferase n=1 Tax=Flavobacterium sp. TaxID=239 RepID=UPI0026184C0E|nr:sugar transferase [Flavobacterium sp.]MDD3003623.1 sugar transferase [Flavobacterium sp.]